jgi:predicted nucleotide-binding protein
MNLEFLQTPLEKVGYLANLLSSHACGSTSNPVEYSALRHELLADQNIGPDLPSFVRLNRDLSSFWQFIKHKFPTYAERRNFISLEFTPLLDRLEFGATKLNTLPILPTISLAEGKATNTFVPVAPAEPVAVVARNKRKVFIVHGRDNEAKQEVARFVDASGLEAIILHEQASAGMTIIEKIERYANDADFALVLYSPCDLGRGKHETTVPARPRARQNVVFEHGYLMAKLGRENVCALVKGNIETPNDISGVVYVQLDEFGGWKLEVAKELTACGYVLK